MDPIEQFANIQSLVQKEIDDKILKYAEETKYNLVDIPAHTHNGVDSSPVDQSNLNKLRPVYSGSMASGTNIVTIYRLDVTENTIIDVYADLSSITGNWTVLSFNNGFTVSSTATPEVNTVTFKYFINN